MIPSCFSFDYAEARSKFLVAAKEAGFDTTTYANDTVSGPNGADLYTDVVRMGPKDAPATLLFMSGTHGVEGFCGSGCQVEFLRTLKDRDLPAGLQVVLIHAINPHGFAWLRRVNEDNVDLNRNFVDHSKPHPENPDYEALRDVIAPQDISKDALRAANSALRAYSEEHGPAALQKAVSCGQYTYDKGVYYGGTFDTWSNRTFRAIVTDTCATSKSVALVDFHTGLGPHGFGEMIIEVGPDDPAYDRAKTWWGSNTKSTVTGESVSAQLNGTIDGTLPEMLPHAAVTAGAIEFGTRPSNEVFRALRKDNWLHAFSDPSELGAKAIKDEIRAAFYPDTDEWKEMIVARGREVIDQAIDGLTSSGN